MACLEWGVISALSASTHILFAQGYHFFWCFSAQSMTAWSSAGEKIFWLRAWDIEEHVRLAASEIHRAKCPICFEPFACINKPVIWKKMLHQNQFTCRKKPLSLYMFLKWFQNLMTVCYFYPRDNFKHESCKLLLDRGLNSRIILLTHMVPEYNSKIYRGNYVVITSVTLWKHKLGNFCCQNKIIVK